MQTKSQSTDDEEHEQAICSSDAHMLGLFFLQGFVRSLSYLIGLIFVSSVDKIRIFCFFSKINFPSASDISLYSADSEE